MDRSPDWNARRITSRDTLDLGAGEESQWDLSFEHQVLRLQIVEERSGRPLRNAECVIWMSLLGLNVRTDQEGWITLAPSPVESFQVEIRPELMSIDTYQMPAGETEASLTVEMRRRRG